MACLKEEFKSIAKFVKFNIKKEFVFGLWLEIFKDQKEIHICVDKKELDEIYQQISFLLKKVCFRCGREECFTYDSFKFIHKQYMHYIGNGKTKMLWKIYLKTNQYGFELKHVI